MTPLLVLVQIAEGRADLESRKLTPPYVVHLPPKRAMRLHRELRGIGVSFGLPLDGFVPDPKEDDNEWIYFGIVLSDVHVYGRAR